MNNNLKIIIDIEKEFIKSIKDDIEYYTKNNESTNKLKFKLKFEKNRVKKTYGIVNI